MNGEPHDGILDYSDTAFALVDRTLSAIGGLDTDDPLQALDTVLAMYERALARLAG